MTETPSSSPDHATMISTYDHPLPVAQARQRSLCPSMSWVYPTEAALGFLQRQQQRAETRLHLEAVIVQDERGMVALWTRDMEICSRAADPIRTST